MKAINLFVAVVVVVAIGAAVWWWPNEDRAIKRRLDALAETLSTGAGDSDLTRLSKAAQLRGYFAPAVHVRIGSQEISSRDVLVALVGRWVPPPGGLTVAFVDVQVARDDDQAMPRVYLTAKLSGRNPSTGEPTLDAREANLVVAKRDGEWVIVSAEAAETLQRP